MKSTQGFTLIELLIVIAIIGILAAVLIPNLLGARKKANDSSAQSYARNCYSAAEIERNSTTQEFPSSIKVTPPSTDGTGVKCAEGTATPGTNLGDSNLSTNAAVVGSLVKEMYISGNATLVTCVKSSTGNEYTFDGSKIWEKKQAGTYPTTMPAYACTPSNH